MDAILWIVTYLLATVGLVQVAGWGVCRMLRPKRRAPSSRVIRLPSDPGELEAQLRYTLAQIRWNGWGGDERLFFIDCGLGEEARKVCHAMIGDRCHAVVCREEELPEFLHAVPSTGKP